MKKKSPCIPEILPNIEIDWVDLVQYMSEATEAVGRFDGAMEGMINANVLMTPLTRKEAILSSRIEGTQATLVEVLEHEAGKTADNEEKKNDIQEIQNYREALSVGEKDIEERGITLSLIRELHEVLMSSVRGESKDPGMFRKDQNWIGKPNCPIEEARFIPPSPEIMGGCLSNLEDFTNSSYKSPLVQLALIHAQFEIIHPFRDGNGRVGRMLIPLFLYHKKVLKKPVFYLSQYLEKHDQQYRDGLLAITEEGDWQGWIKFFLKALKVQALDNLEKAKKIHDLYEMMKIAFEKHTNSRFYLTACDTFFAVPIINVSNFHKISNIKNYKTAYSILKQLEEVGIIVMLREGAGRQSAIYAFPELLNIVEGREVFKAEEES